MLQYQSNITLLPSRALGWLFLQLYLTGRQPAQSAPAKAPPSPGSVSSSETDSSAPKGYVRCPTVILWLAPQASGSLRSYNKMSDELIMVMIYQTPHRTR